MTLDQLNLKTPAKVTKISSEATEDVFQRLVELGVSPKQDIEILHKAPLGGDPIAARVCNNLVGIGSQEAKYIHIELV